MSSGKYVVGAPTEVLFSTKTWNGANDPKKVAWNPYTMSSARQIRRPAARFSTTTGQYIDSPLLYGTTLWCPPFSTFTSNDDLRLLSKAAETARQHSFNLAVSGAELGQTLGMIKDRCVSVLGALRAARKGDLHGAARILLPGSQKRKFKSTDISGQWLELQYGWLPLIGDVHAGMQYIASKHNGPRMLAFDVQGTARVKNQVSNSPTTYSIIADGSVTRFYRVQYTEVLSEARSLGLLNPASVIWEKMPWSFVADWFIPIGTYLDTLSVLPHLNATLCRTDFARASANFSAPATRVDGIYTLRGGGVSYSATRMERYAPVAVTRGTIPVPSFNTLDRALSLGHIKNAAALIWTQIAKSR